MTRRARTRLIWVSVVMPITIVLIGIVISLAWLDDLPDPVAVHWGVNGVTGFAPAWTQIVWLAAVGIGIPLLFGGILLASGKPGPTPIQKLLASCSLGTSVVIDVLVVGSLALQRGLADAADAPDIGWLVAVALGAGVLAGIVGWFLLPKSVSSAARAMDVPVIPLTVDESAVWIAGARLPVGATIALGVAVIGVTVATAYAIAVTDGRLWPFAFLPILLIAALLATVSWRVRIDASGFLVRSLIGWPRIRIPLDQVERAGVIQVAPIADYGGWGIRWGNDNSVGIVTRTGEAIDVTRRAGRSVVVTVDDAATGAGLLTALARLRAGA